MAKGFSDKEKDGIKSNLISVCKQSWTQLGYKKTSIDDLCTAVGISKGAFYIFFDSKEALFCDVLCDEQDKIYTIALDAIEKNPNRTGVANAIKLVYREYSDNNFLYNSSSSDYINFTNKLSFEQLSKIQSSSERCNRLFISHPKLKLKTSPEMALSVIYALIMNVKVKEFFPCDHVEVFDYMIAQLINAIYEE